MKVNPKRAIFVLNKMVLKRFYLTLLLVTITTLAFAQDDKAEFGIKIGLQNHNVVTPETISLESSAELVEMSIGEIDYGFHAGFYGRFKFLKLYWEPALLLNSQGITYLVKESDDSVTEVKEYYQDLDIPLNIGFKIAFVKIHAGPVAHIHLNSTSELFDVEGYEQKFKNATFGYQAGLGLDFKKLRLSLNYEGNFTNYGDHISFEGEGYTFSESPSRLIFSIGLAF